MKLSVIIVSWNVREELIGCLRSLRDNRPRDEYEVIVVDNASTDGTAEAVKRSFPHLRLIANSENRGFATANNQGIKESQGEYVLLLNPDTIVRPKSLNILIKFMDENKDVGVCGPKLLNENGTTQPSTRRFPTFRAALHRHTIFRSIGIFRKQYRRWLMKDFSHDEQTDVDQLMGACLLVRKSVLEEVGVLDEDFFMYYEEVDLCFRIKRAGYRVVFVPEAAIVHLGGRSATQVPVRKRIAAMTSLLKFFKKHYGGFSTGLFACLFKPAIALKDIMNIVVSSITYVFSAAVSNRKRCEKCSKEIKNSVQLLAKYSWLSLFKV